MNDINDLVCLEIELFKVLFFALSVPVHALALSLALGSCSILLLLDEDLVSLLDLDLVVFQRQADAHVLFVGLQEITLLGPVVIVIDVVTQGTLQCVHLLDHCMVLLSIQTTKST